MTQAELAEKLGLHANHLNAILKGRVRASWNLALRIEEASEGEYKAVELRPDLKDMAKKVVSSL